MTTVESNIASFRRLIEVGWNKKDRQTIENSFSTEFRNITEGSPQLSSVQSILARFQKIVAGFPNFEFTIVDIVAHRDEVIGVLSYAGANTGSFAGEPPTGKQIQGTAVIIARYDKEGKI